MWEAVNQSAHEPVVRLLPYLRLKHRQAELALTLITLIKHEKAGSGRPLTDKQEQARRLLFEEAQLLNKSPPAECLVSPAALAQAMRRSVLRGVEEVL